LPLIRAAIELQRNRPQQAIEALQKPAPFELSSTGPGLETIYLRGQAYLRLKKGNEAAEEFRKIPGNPTGIANLDALQAVARLGLARAKAMAGDTAAARTAYQDLLALWKDADRDLPVLQQAKAEYAKLQ